MKKGLITSILALTFGSLQAQPLPPSPKLVVTLTIDQLRTDYMEAFSSLYGEKGFKRLLREGKVFRQADYSFNVTDRASAIATLYTGTTPSMNGIIAEQWLDAGTLRPINCVEDPNFMGNYTDESTSPSQLLTSTIADELKIATRNKGLVYAIAPFRDAAILGAGHAGNGAFWCLLAESSNRQMVRHNLLRRVSLVAEPIQRRAITRLPHQGDGVESSSPHHKLYIPARMAHHPFQV